MTTSAKTITIGGVSSTSKVDAMGKTENGKTGKSEIAQNLPGSPTTAARRRVTLRDVATAAGVSLKTASNVINGTGRMTDATRAKVEAVIEQTGYRVNVAARNLNRARTGFITLAVPTLTAPYLSELANRVIDAARQCGYLVYVTTYAEGSATGARELLRNFNTTVSDGMILSMSEVEDINPEGPGGRFPAGGGRRANHVGQGRSCDAQRRAGGGIGRRIHVRLRREVAGGGRRTWRI